MALRLRIPTGAAIFLISIGAFAQGNNNDEQAEDDAARVLEPITVTGYHIKRIDLEGLVRRLWCSTAS